MFPEGEEGDSVCFTCGHVVYGRPILLTLDEPRRRPSHGGNRLT
jgi:hypothetical protein